VKIDPGPRHRSACFRASDQARANSNRAVGAASQFSGPDTERIFKRFQARVGGPRCEEKTCCHFDRVACATFSLALLTWRRLFLRRSVLPHVSGKRWRAPPPVFFLALGFDSTLLQAPRASLPAFLQSLVWGRSTLSVSYSNARVPQTFCAQPHQGRNGCGAHDILLLS
jgi:hypothetical protein